MFNHILECNDSDLAQALALPQNDSAYGNEGPHQFDMTMGAVEAVVLCEEDISVADTKSLSIVLVHGDTEAACTTELGETFSETADGAALTYDAGDEICRLSVPSSLKQYGNIKVTTDDAAATGKIKALLNFLPR